MTTFLFVFLLGLSSQALEVNTLGTYMVPTSKPELQPYSLFELSEVKLKMDDGKVEIEYQIPQALTGVLSDIHMSGTQVAVNQWKLYGDSGAMNCVSVDSYMSCRVGYHTLGKDDQAREDFLRSVSVTPEEFDLRLQLAMGFDGERIGIVRFKIK